MNDRRNFLKKMFTTAVFTGVAPHILLGELTPADVIEDENAGTIQDIYYVDLDTEEPETGRRPLREDFGSINIPVWDSEISFMKNMYVTHVPEEVSKGRFSILLDTCPHEHQKIFPLHSIEHIFLCSGHGSVFNVMGRWESGPAAQDLQHYNDRFYTWKPTDKYLRINFTFYKSNVSEESLHTYLRGSYPNPFRDNTTIIYGIDKDAYMQLEVVDIAGRAIYETPKEYKTVGEYREPISLPGFPVGVYMVNLYMNGAFARSIKINKEY